MRKILLALALLAIPSLAHAQPRWAPFMAQGPSAGLNCPGSPGCTNGAWRFLNIGAGGDVSGLMVAADGTQVASTDSASAYMRTAPGTTWQNVQTFNSLQAAFIANGCTSPCWMMQSMQSTCAIVVAPSNTQHFYLMMALNAAGAPLPTTGRIYSTTNQGTAWSLTNSSFSRPVINQACASPSGTDSELRNHQPILAVDPQNEAVVWASDTTNGVYFTLNSGTLWTQISTATIPAPVNQNALLVAFDPRPAQHTVYVASNGNGVWQCTAANTSTPSCTKLNTTGMPTGFHLLRVDAKGTLWVIDGVPGAGSGNLWQWQSSPGWTEAIVDTGVCCFDVDPGDATGNTAFAVDWNYGGASTHFYAIAAAQSSGAGLTSSITSIDQTHYVLTANTIKWPVSANYSGGGALQGIGMAFDPSQSHQLYINTGIGVTGLKNPPTTVGPSVTFNRDETIGIENLVGEVAFPLNAGGMYFISADILAWLPADVRANQFVTMLGAQHGIQLIDQANSGCTDGNQVFLAVAGFTNGGNSIGNFGLTYNTAGGAGAWGGPVANPNNPGQFFDGNCLVRSATNWLYMANGTNWYTSTGGTTNTFAQCTFNAPTGGGAAPLYNDGGWFGATIDAGGTILFYNNGRGANAAALGVWKSTSGCSSIAQVNNALALYNSGQGATGSLFAAPGLTCNPTGGAAVFWAITGKNPHGGNPLGPPDTLYSSSDCGTTWSVAIPSTTLAGLFTIGWGKALTGSNGFPTFYCACSYSNNGGTSYTYGIWQIQNINTGSPIFTNIDAADGGYPTGIAGTMQALFGDLVQEGTVYACWNGQSCAYRTAH